MWWFEIVWSPMAMGWKLCVTSRITGRRTKLVVSLTLKIRTSDILMYRCWWCFKWGGLDVDILILRIRYYREVREGWGWACKELIQSIIGLESAVEDEVLRLIELPTRFSCSKSKSFKTNQQCLRRNLRKKINDLFVWKMKIFWRFLSVWPESVPAYVELWIFLKM